MCPVDQIIAFKKFKLSTEKLRVTNTNAFALLFLNYITKGIIVE